MLDDEQIDWVEKLAELGRRLLKQASGFSPYLGAMTADGESQMIGIDLGDHRPEMGELIEHAKNSLIKMIHEQDLQRAAYFYDGRVTDIHGNKSDCVIGHVEMADGTCVRYVQTYKIGFLKRVKFGEPVVMPAEPELLGASLG